jgi:hypothetical protein
MPQSVLVEFLKFFCDPPNFVYKPDSVSVSSPHPPAARDSIAPGVLQARPQSNRPRYCYAVHHHRLPQSKPTMVRRSFALTIVCLLLALLLLTYPRLDRFAVRFPSAVVGYRK